MMILHRLAPATLAFVTLATVLLGMPAPLSAQDGVKRTILQKSEYPTTHDTTMGMAEIAPGRSIGRHTHPGVETGYVIEGDGLIMVEGQPDLPVKAGDTYKIAAGVPHDAKPTGDKPIKVLAVWVVERGQPLAKPAP